MPKEKKKTWDNMTEEEREWYINQDYVPRDKRIHLIGAYWAKDKDQWGNVPNFDKVTSSQRKFLIIKLWQDGKSIRDISIHAECSRQYVSKVINEYKLLESKFWEKGIKSNMLEREKTIRKD